MVTNSDPNTFGMFAGDIVLRVPRWQQLEEQTAGTRFETNVDNPPEPVVRDLGRTTLARDDVSVVGLWRDAGLIPKVSE